MRWQVLYGTGDSESKLGNVRGGFTHSSKRQHSELRECTVIAVIYHCVYEVLVACMQRRTPHSASQWKMLSRHLAWTRCRHKCVAAVPACPRNTAPTHVSVSVLQRMVIHIDTEGNEYNVVPALASFVQRRAKRPVLVVEMHGDPPSIFNANQVCTVCMLPVTLCCCDIVLR